MPTDTTKPDKNKPSCPKCGNRLRVLPDQIGTTVRCPKCNAKFVIGGERKKKAKTAAPAPTSQAPAAASSPEPALDDSYLPEIPLKRSTIVPEETPQLPEQEAKVVPDAPPALGQAAAPVVPEQQLTGETPYAAQQSEYEVDWSTADELAAEAPAPPSAATEEQYLESARARGLIRDFAEAAPPRWTFFSGVFGYPWRGVNLARWTTMSVALGLAAACALAALRLLGLIGGELSVSALLGVFVGIIAIGITLAAMSFAVGSCQAAVQDTADGHDMPQEASLSDWGHAVLMFLAWLSLWAAAGALGFPLSLLIGPLAFLICATLFFPVLLLSALESNSYLIPFSPPVLRTLGYYWHGWLMFYLLTTAMIAAWVVAFDFAYPHAPYLTAFFSGSVLATIMLIYARLLGRVAWRASGAPAVAVEREQPLHSAGSKRETAAESQPAKPPRRTKQKKRRFRQIQIPDEIDTAEPQEQSPRRINFHLRP